MTSKEAIEILMSDEKLAEIEYYGGFERQKEFIRRYIYSGCYCKES